MTMKSKKTGGYSPKYGEGLPSFGGPQIAFGLLAERFVNRDNGHSVQVGEGLSVPNPPPLN
jgi:hypothetical protein